MTLTKPTDTERIARLEEQLARYRAAVRTAKLNAAWWRAEWKADRMGSVEASVVLGDVMRQIDKLTADDA